MTSLRHELHALADDLRTESRQWARCSGFAQRLEAILNAHPEPADAALAAFTSDGPPPLRFTALTAVQANEAQYETLYGLDRDGCVHECDFRGDFWRPVTMERAP